MKKKLPNIHYKPDEYGVIHLYSNIGNRYLGIIELSIHGYYIFNTITFQTEETLRDIHLLIRYYNRKHYPVSPKFPDATRSVNEFFADAAIKYKESNILAGEIQTVRKRRQEINWDFKDHHYTYPPEKILIVQDNAPRQAEFFGHQYVKSDDGKYYLLELNRLNAKVYTEKDLYDGNKEEIDKFHKRLEKEGWDQIKKDYHHCNHAFYRSKSGTDKPCIRFQTFKLIPKSDV